MTRFFVLLISAIVAIIILVGSAIFSVVKAYVVITINKTDQTMYVETPTEFFTWKVSTARPGYHTPTGEFKPYRLERLHYSKKYDNAPMPNSIFFVDSYAIHATYDIHNLGRPASHGCVRLSPQNAKWLYRIVQENGMENTYINITE